MELLTKNKLLTAVLAVLSVAGIGAYIFQLAGGLAVTGMSNGVSWGLYITMFMFFVGLSAGGLIVASSASVFHIKRFKAVAMPAIILSTVCICLAGMFVLIDLGGIQRIWRIVTGPNPTSPLVWDICVITLYLVINVLYLVNMRRGNDHAVSIISRFALPCAILVHSVTAWIFGLQQGREMWHTALLAPWFVSSALVCGTALVMVVAIALRRAGYLSLDQAYLVKLAKLLGAFVVVDLYFFGCDLLTEAFPGGSGAEVVAMLTAGPLVPYFWTEVVGCALCAVICFTPALRTNALLVAGSLLAILGIFCKRVQLLVGGFQIANLDYAGPLTPMQHTAWDSGLSGIYGGMVYWPTPLELGVTLGVVALGVLVFLLGIKLLPLRPKDDEAPSE